MTHIAITELLDGKNVEWMEKVSASNIANDHVGLCCMEALAC
jgi:hypothetical protein